ncbi:MAG: pectate lyase [Haloarculaceae archaeon]
MPQRSSEGDSDDADGRDCRVSGPESAIRLSRRDLLAASGIGLVGALAGCPGGGNPTESPPDPTDTTAEPTSTSTPTPRPTTTSRATAEPTAEPTTTTAGTDGFDTRYLDTSPGSTFAPTDGFGSVDWLEGTEPEVLKVTTLEPTGEGSLPWALRQSGPRVVVFEVGGVIDLAGRTLSTDEGNLYVAGQTAPSPGVTVIRGGVFAGGANTLVQHLRVRPGDELGGEIDGDPNGSATDALSVDSDTPNVVFDHCSVSWGTDENMSASGGRGNTDLTFSNNLVAEGLSHSPLHEEAEHSKGTLINDWATDTSVVGNVYVHHTDRHPRIKGGSSCAVVNNFVYNYAEAIEMGGGPDEPALGSVVGNLFKAGPATNTTAPLIVAEGQGGARAYVDGNAGDPTIGDHEADLDVMTMQPLWPQGLEPMDVGKVPEHNLSTAGARPADRSPTDKRLIGYARQGKGTRIDSQTEVGGYPELPERERTLDPPPAGDGLAEWLHQHTKAVERPGSSPP